MNESGQPASASEHDAPAAGAPDADAVPAWTASPDRAVVERHGPGDVQIRTGEAGYPPPAPSPLGEDGDRRPGAPWPAPPGRRPSRVAAVLVVVAVLAAAGIGLVIGHVAWGRSASTTPATSSVPTSSVPTTAPTSSAPTSPASTTPVSSSPGGPSNAAAIAAGVAPALVDIDVTDSYQAVEGAGTGMVLSSTGEVLTNNHVVEGATSITVTDVGNGRIYDATVTGYDRTKDVAVIQLAGASGLETVRPGNSSDVRVGDGVVVIGNAEGAGGTPSAAAGSVTALGRSITAEDEMSRSSEQLSGLIETDAEVVPGDSGGALVNRSGKVVGMITAGSQGFQFQGTSEEGYAIPVDDALGIARQIENHRSSGAVHIGPTAFLGVEVEAPFSGIAGAEIVAVVPSGPAAVAGLTPGDVMTSFGGRQVSSPDALTDLILGATPGTSVEIGYLDPSGLAHTVRVSLASGPPQ